MLPLQPKSNLRAAGAFLVIASLKDEQVFGIEILSEAGTPLKIVLPWENCIMVQEEGKSKLESKEVEISAERGELITCKPKE